MRRRDLLLGGALSGVAWGARANQNQVPKVLDTGKLQPFVDPLPRPQYARPLGLRPDPANPKKQLPFYRIPMRPALVNVHRDLPPTRMWSYGGTVPGPTVEVQKGEAVLIDWPNELPAKHMFPIDHTLMGAEAGKPEVRTVVHLHGAKAPPISDGYPENWYTPGNSVVYRYPNEQDAATLWYHDHAMGITRLNMMSGLFGLYIVRDDEEAKLSLPGGEYEVPLVLADRLFTEEGQLYYPVSNDKDSPWIPEFFGNAVLVNGKLLPFLEVEPRPYRFRVANFSNGRFYNLSLANGEVFLQMGTDQGLISQPLELKTVFLAPAERCDVLIDFTRHAGDQFSLRNGVVDVMQFRVARMAASTAQPLPAVLRSVPAVLESEAVRTRFLTLEEDDDAFDGPMVHLLNGMRWHDPVTEQPKVGSTEIWAFLNMTDDSHPIHLHLVRFQILDRRSFDDVEYFRHKKIRYTDEPVSPSPGERGWKDTVQAHPKMVTRIIVRFEGYVGRYVWHCHILEHEDNEMMRPFEILPLT